MNVGMHRAWKLAAMALIGLQGAAAYADIVNIDAIVSGCTTCNNYIAPGTVVTMISPVQLTLAPGTYTIRNAATVNGVEPGANPQFLAWNVQAGRPDAWAWAFIIAADNGNGTATTINTYAIDERYTDLCCLATTQLGEASKTGVTATDGTGATVPGVTSTANFQVTFTLTATTVVDFAAVDYYPPDNAGGMALDVSPQVTSTLLGLSINGGNVCGTGPATGTVTLTAPAGPGGATITLLSNRANVADGPATVTVPAGQTQATFPITTGDVNADSAVTLQALYNGQVASASLTVHPLLASLAFTPTYPGDDPGGAEICSETTAQGTITLNCPAPRDETVTLVALDASGSFSEPAAPVPATVLIPLGQSSATFSVTGGEVMVDTNATVKATLGITTQTAPLTIHPLLGDLTLTPDTVPGTKDSIATLSLTFNVTNGQVCVAPPGGLSVNLTSDNSEVARPAVAGLTFPPGSNQATFRVTTDVPTEQTCAAGLSSTGTCAVNVVASAAGGVQSATLTVTQPAPPTAADVTSLLTLRPSGIFRDPFTRRWVQLIVIVNRGGQAIQGPMALVLDYYHPHDSNADAWKLSGALDLRTRLADSIGATKATAPVGRPYATLALGAGEVAHPGSLGPGEWLLIALTFDDPTGTPITYQPAVLAGGAF